MFYATEIPETVACSFGILRPYIKTNNIIFFENPLEYCTFDRLGLIVKILIPFEIPTNYKLDKGLLDLDKNINTFKTFIRMSQMKFLI